LAAKPLSAHLQVDEPLLIGQTSFFGAVMSEQAARTTEATTVATIKSLRRIMGVSPDEGSLAY
jgi:hypothetical protein